MLARVKDAARRFAATFFASQRKSSLTRAARGAVGARLRKRPRAKESEMLRIYEVALELVREVAPLAVEIGRKDPDLARQLRRALSSVPLNISEGSYARGAWRDASYQVAMGSAREALSCLETAEAWGIAGAVPQALRDRFGLVISTLRRCVIAA